ncbi:MAG: hypothetical protein HY951_01245 [Bacteroidia bacterium]|nr:hypothetical protein [Bacteroidia bacterium]
MKTNVDIALKRFSKTSFFIIVIIFFSFSFKSFCQKSLVFKQNIPIESGKKKKALKDVTEWASTQNLFKLKTANTVDTIVGEGYFDFVNPVKYESSPTYSRMYISQTNGRIDYKVYIVVKDNEMDFIVSNFKHIPASKGEKIEFGVLSSLNEAPNFLKTDYDAAWCDKVWESMKKMAEENAQRFFDQIPASLVTSR